MAPSTSRANRRVLATVFAFMAACLVSPSIAEAQDAGAHERRLPLLFTADTDHSSVAFEVLHVGLTRVRGTFEEWAAALTYDPETPTHSSVSTVIGVASLDTNSQRRDDDLRSSNFFDVESFPTADFRSTAVREVSGNLLLDGKLRIRDSTKTVSFPVVFLGEAAGRRSDRLGFEGEITLTREDFGVVNEGNILERLGVIGKEVDVEIQFSAIRLRHEDGEYRDTEEGRSIGSVLEEILTNADLDAALDRYGEYLEEETEESHFSELVTLANRLIARDRSDDAGKLLELFVQRNPDNAAGHFWLGETLAEAGRDEAALQHFQAAVERDPFRADALERIRYLSTAAEM